MDETAQKVRRWWRTSIVDIKPGQIRLRGYSIEELIGNVGFAETLYLMLRGELPQKAQAALLEAALVACVDHGPQAPSIAIARMAMTTGCDINNAMGSAVNVLGDVHGGAGQQCMGIFAEIDGLVQSGKELRAAARYVIEDYRAKVDRFVPGFGHRFHPVDPRAPRLLALVDAAAAEGTVSGRFAAIGRAVETIVSEGGRRAVRMNVDGVTAVVFSELDFPPELGRGMFVLARSVGILAHAWEQAGQGERIKGPTPPEFLYEYDGPPPRSL